MRSGLCANRNHPCCCVFDAARLVSGLRLLADHIASAGYNGLVDRPEAVELFPWKPGCSGKGVVFGDGMVKSWRVDPVEGHPHHTPALKALGRDFSAAMMFFIVDPDGSFEFVPEPSDEDSAAVARSAITAKDPRMRYASSPGSSWTFD